jgi:hypothetical protein
VISVYVPAKKRGAARPLLSSEIKVTGTMSHLSDLRN